MIASAVPLNGTLLWHTWELFMCRACHENRDSIPKTIMTTNIDNNDIAIQNISVLSRFHTFIQTLQTKAPIFVPKLNPKSMDRLTIADDSMNELQVQSPHEIMGRIWPNLQHLR